MHSLRLHCTGRPEAKLTPATGTCPPAVWDADDLELHVWLDSGTLTAGARTAFDITTLATLRLEMRETPTTETLLCAAKELTSFTACTFDAFRAATGQHATFEFSSTDTNFASTLDQVWISIVGEDTDGKRHTFTAGCLAIVRNGDSTSTDPVQDPINPYARQADLDAALARIAELESDAPTLTDSGAGYATLTVGGVTVRIPTVTVG